MPQVAITKVKDADKKTLPVFGEITRRLEAVQQRAFDLFEKRGRELGRDLEDWFKAEHELLGSAAAELTEENDAYKLAITLPGFEAKDVEVTATPNEVIVHAATENEKKTQKGNVLSDGVWFQRGLPAFRGAECHQCGSGYSETGKRHSANQRTKNRAGQGTKAVAHSCRQAGDPVHSDRLAENPA